MKRITIEEVDNGWIVSETNGTDRCFGNSNTIGKTLVFRDIKEFQEQLPSILEKPPVIVAH